MYLFVKKLIKTVLVLGTCKRIDQNKKNETVFVPSNFRFVVTTETKETKITVNFACCRVVEIVVFPPPKEASNS